jgi:hypothetical protein
MVDNSDLMLPTDKVGRQSKAAFLRGEKFRFAWRACIIAAL